MIYFQALDPWDTSLSLLELIVELVIIKLRARLHPKKKKSQPLHSWPSTKSLPLRVKNECPWVKFLWEVWRGPDMNPTTDHVHLPERAIIRSNTKKIQVSNKENNGMADIGKWLEDFPLVVELPIKTIYELPYILQFIFNSIY